MRMGVDPKPPGSRTSTARVNTMVDVSMSQHPSEGSDTSEIGNNETTTPREAPTFLKPDQELGDYRIVARLGAGGMGEVYEAVDGRTQETVALKVMKWRNPAREIRFKREFRVLAEVRHENLVRPRELIATDEYFFFTMDLCEGPNLVGHVRHEVSPGQLPNLTRLRRALRQLVAGVSALHDKGLLHRDLKPSNVLVTHHGLVRILDFGLVRDVNVSVDITAEGQMLGTPAYMAPEQAAATPATQASDWYAVGTMLYELLTGERPFTGSLLEVVTSKSDPTPPDPRDKIASAPEDLAQLAMSLMMVDPKARPGAEEILDVLGVDASAETGTGLRLDHQPLIGRDTELATLRAAFERVRVDGQSVTVHLQAESGMGKSKLISEFLATPSPAYPPFILRGRCFERESVPYKGLDGVIDSLSSQLRHLDELEAAAILPRDVTSLSRLFPVFSQIPAVAKRRPRAAAGLDPQEARQRGVAALRELLARLGDLRPLIIIIDDFQWADPDSARLLNELMTEPDGPALFLIVAFRPEVESRAALATLTSPAETAMRDIQVLELAPLRDEDVEALANHLLGETSPQLVDQALRARGTPSTSARSSAAANRSSRLRSSTSWSPVASAARTNVATSARIIAVAAGPVPLDTVSQAAGDDHIDITRSLVGTLRRDGLVQMEDDGWVECAHDRIRETAVSDMAPSRLRSQHLQLGQLLESGEGHDEALLEHFEQGGDVVRAAHYAEEAAAVAYATFAFDRTVELLQRALQLVPDPAPEVLFRRKQLLADALNDVGRGKEAAQLWLDVAEHLPREEGRLLQRRAAESLIKTGHVEDGLAVLDSLLEAFDLSLPRTRSRALAALLWERGRVAVRGRSSVRSRPAVSPPSGSSSSTSASPSSAASPRRRCSWAPSSRRETTGCRSTRASPTARREPSRTRPWSRCTSADGGRTLGRTGSGRRRSPTRSRIPSSPATSTCASARDSGSSGGGPRRGASSRISSSDSMASPTRAGSAIRPRSSSTGCSSSRATSQARAPGCSRLGSGPETAEISISPSICPP